MIQCPPRYIHFPAYPSSLVHQPNPPFPSVLPIATQQLPISPTQPNHDGSVQYYPIRGTAGHMKHQAHLPRLHSLSRRLRGSALQRLALLSAHESTYDNGAPEASSFERLASECTLRRDAPTNGTANGYAKKPAETSQIPMVLRSEYPLQSPLGDANSVSRFGNSRFFLPCARLPLRYRHPKMRISYCDSFRRT